jgi:phosphoenolpyruvate-protein kinase (PTS system EI component)
MPERVLSGIPASPGIAAGRARVLDPRLGDAEATPVWRADRPAEAARAEEAMRSAGEEISKLAHRLRGEGREEEAEIIATGALLALDPELLSSVRAEVLERGRSAPVAILEATDEAAAKLAGLDDPMLAARADDVRSLGRRAARLGLGARPTGDPTDGWQSVVLVATDLGPADVAELGAEVGGIALAAGAVTAHAAIVARSLGLPMVVAIGDELTAIADGEPIVVDGTGGTLVASPSLARATQARLAGKAREQARRRAASDRALPAITLDGRRVTVLANVASAAEVGVALDAGAEGVGLLRTELAFLDSGAWPTEEQHRRELEPVLAPLAGRLATVRVLDFGADKAPRFLAGERARGIELLLETPEALDAQLRAILAAGRRTDLRVLLPMVNSPAQVGATREALRRAVEAVDGAVTMPPLGAMIETATAVLRVKEIAAEADFLSIGTNDLTASLLGRDRFGTGRLATHDPRVLQAIAATVRTAEQATRTLEVCGEAASDPLVAPLLIGLGVDELSVGASRVGATRAWVRNLRASETADLAKRALSAERVAEVEMLLRETAAALELAERGDAADQGVNGAGSVVPLRPQA